MKENLPLIIRVDIPQTKFDVDAVDAEIFCVNTTSVIFSISSNSESFTTVDEEIGTVAQHGSDPVRISLAPGEFRKIAEVHGWEWDGHVGISIVFQSNEKKNSIVKNYDFKQSKSDFDFPNSALTGRIIPPLK